MTKILKGLCVSALALSFAAAPAVAAPFIPNVAAPDGSTVEKVQFDPNWRRIERQIDRAERRSERRAERRAMRDLERRGDLYYYNGYRGFREHRPGYREYNGMWFPAAAFIAGAIVTGAIQAERGAGNHVDWCYDRYQSYRASDNTYNPGRGLPRRQCNSPFD